MVRNDPDPAGPAEQAGLAHVATASFLASRVAPTGGFAIALAGGVALARAAQCAGARTGYGASLAAMLQTVAVMGPARIGIPLTQALSAPLLGRLHARGAAFAARLAACAGVRLADQLANTAFTIWIILGGVDVYAGTYDTLLGGLPLLPEGAAGALVTTVAALLVWTLFASVVQVAVYRRGLLGWPRAQAPAGVPARPDERPRRAPRFDPRAVALSAVVAFAVLLASTAWAVLAAVSAWLVLAWATARAESAPVRSGVALAATLAAGALAFGLVSGAGLDLTLQRTARAALLVLVATWLRAAAGEEGLREVARRGLHRARRLPAAAEAAAILERLGARGGLADSGRALVETVRDVPRRASPLAAAVLLWIADEAARFAPAATAPAPAVLRARPRDRALVALAVAAAVTLALPAS
ncbi:MAG: hypothetical protein QOD69_2100 [Solirubrobacteraceae bacterium]|jgi:hypothetical protein|nr:hypothetical protein [Solirubrobacteraceae bacterium]